MRDWGARRREEGAPRKPGQQQLAQVQEHQKRQQVQHGLRINGCEVVPGGEQPPAAQDYANPNEEHGGTHGPRRGWKVDDAGIFWCLSAILTESRRVRYTGA